MLKLFYFLSFAFSVHIATCDTNTPCDLDDEDCVSASHKIIIKTVIAGIPAKGVKSSDPLHQDIVEVYQPNMNLTLTDANMYGTLACETYRVKIKNNIWHLVMLCPKLRLLSNYDISGSVDSIPIEGKGDCEIVYENYIVGMNGTYEIYKTLFGLEHFNITSYKLQYTDVQEKVVYRFNNLFHGDDEKSTNAHEYINKNWKTLHSIIGEPITYSLFGYFVENVNKFLVTTPRLEVFYKPPSFSIPKKFVPKVSFSKV